MLAIRGGRLRVLCGGLRRQLSVPPLPPQADLVEETIEGSVERVIFRSTRNNYAVVELKLEAITEMADESKARRRRARKATIFGTCPPLEEGAFVRVRGTWHETRRHGLQLKASDVAQVTPTSADATQRYLRLFRGVGVKRARDLVAAFPNVFEVLERDPDKLLGVKGFGKAALKKLLDEWHVRRAAHEAAAFLHSVGIGPAIAERLVARLGGTAESCAKAIRDDPYKVASDSRQLLSFPRADALALKNGFAVDDVRRVREALVYMATRLATAGGHTSVPRPDLIAAVTGVLALKPGAATMALLNEQVDLLVAQGRLRSLDGHGKLLSPDELFALEQAVAESVRAICCAPHPLPYADPEMAVRAAERSFGGAGLQRLEAMQAEAIRQVMSRKFVVVTGGPGVGKTTAIASIVGSFRRMGLTTVVASPTGRASAKLAQVTNQPAATLHRLLEYDPTTEQFKRNASNKLQGALFLVDEASMVDAQLAASFLAAVPERAVVVLVGDVDQLPAIGAGNVLSDLVQCPKIPTVRLERIFRQKERESHIVRVAYAMLQGETPAMMPYDVGSGLETFASFSAEADLRFVEASTPAKVMSSVLRVMDDLKRRFDVDPLDDVQVLTAMRKGALGSRAFNAALQHKFNSGAAGVSAAVTLAPNRVADDGLLPLYSFRVGDKVMQVVNDYDKDVFNGEIGRIDSITADGVVNVRFPQTAAPASAGDAEAATRLVSYRGDELRDLDASFACTIHKAQGSEFPVAIIPCHPEYARVLQRNLLYTAVTRASRLAIVVGTMDCFRDTVARTDSTLRRSNLGSLLDKHL